MSFTEIGYQGIRLGFRPGRASRQEAHRGIALLALRVCPSPLAAFEKSNSHFRCFRTTRNSGRVGRSHRPSCCTTSSRPFSGGMFRIGHVPVKREGSRQVELSPMTPIVPLVSRQARKSRALASLASNGHSAESRRALSAKDYIKGMLWSGYDADIWALVLPSLVSLLIEPAMSLVDSVIIGRLGAAALAGCGISVYLCSGVTLLFSFLAMVGTPAVAAALAQQDIPEISRITADGLWLSLAIGFTIALVVGVGCDRMVQAMGATPEVAAQAVAYMRMRVLGAPAQLMMFVATGILRGCRDTRTGARAAAVGFFVNLVLDLTLVLGLHTGVAGAGAATSISQWVNALLMYSALVKRGLFRMADIKAAPDLSRILPVLRRGASLQARSLSIWFVMLNATMVALRCGTAAMAAHEVLRSCWSFCMYAFWALNASSQALVATFVGRGDLENARRVLIRSTQLGALLGVGLSLTLWWPRNVLAYAFTSDAAVTQQVRNTMPLLIFVLPVEAMERALEGGLIACAGEVDWVARNTVVTSAFCLTGLAVVRHWGLGLPAVWAAIKVITFGRTAGAIARYANPRSTLGGFQVISLQPVVPSPPAPLPAPVPAVPVTASAD